MARRQGVIAYIDSSVVVRLVFAQPAPLAEWGAIERGLSSALLRVECLRVVDQARIRFHLSDQEVARRRAAMLELLDAIDLVPLDPIVLDRAAEPFPTSLGTLDALHLATALAIREEIPAVTLTTHDERLGLAAASLGFDVRGTEGAAEARKWAESKADPEFQTETREIAATYRDLETRLD
jgi:predicted nucleic acid-binding protein